MCYPNPYSIISFRYQKVSQLQKSSSTTFFAKVRQNFSDKKSWYPPPMQKVHRYRNSTQTLNCHLLSLLVLWEFFSERKRDFPLHGKNIVKIGCFLKQRRFPLRFFPVLRDKVVPTGKRDISLIGVNFFDTGKILKRRKVHLRKFLVLRDYKFQRKLVIPFPHIQKIFRYQKVSQIHKGSSMTFVTKVRQKYSGRKSWYPFLCRKFLDTKILLKHWMASTKSFGTVRKNISDRKTRLLPSYAKIFSNISETQGGPFTKIFVSLRQ